MNSTKTNILDFAATHSRVNASLLNAAYGLTTVTARQYLSALYKSNDLVRIGHGEYALPKKQIFNYTPSPEVRNMVEGLQKELPLPTSVDMTAAYSLPCNIISPSIKPSTLRRTGTR